MGQLVIIIIIIQDLETIYFHKAFSPNMQR